LVVAYYITGLDKIEIVRLQFSSYTLSMNEQSEIISPQPKNRFLGLSLAGIFAFTVFGFMAGFYFGGLFAVRGPVATPTPTPEHTPSTSATPIAKPSGNSDGGAACTLDALQCPDGSWVGRTGPNCEFVCPEVKTTPMLTPSGFPPQ
jgi:hypothetical protein